jgi:hypothetical protein
VQQKEKPSLDDIDGFPLLYQALKVQCPLDEIKSIVETYEFDDKMDKFGWRALDYACRFNADNFELVAWLLLTGRLEHRRPSRQISYPSSV